MGMAKICDRCGKYYRHYPDGNKEQYNGIGKTLTNQNGNLDYVGKIIDLCPECMDEFNNFMINVRNV